ncbi:hypothetical protein [uncultured Mediterranean phage]|nr:hypothetical protein [uncultured Mediterranean phage]|tara:strand:- start:253 stop:471 length:219 start_codon:yes stop_codon:yes gene_type:complete
MANITVKVNPVTKNTVKQVAIGQVAAENFELNDLKNVDTTTVTPSEGDMITFDATTQKFEAASGIDGGFYGS